MRLVDLLVIIFLFLHGHGRYSSILVFTGCCCNRGMKMMEHVSKHLKTMDWGLCFARKHATLVTFGMRTRYDRGVAYRNNFASNKGSVEVPKKSTFLQYDYLVTWRWAEQDVRCARRFLLLGFANKSQWPKDIDSIGGWVASWTSQFL